eukprot:PhM_4_TR10592/c0_g1_i1/m.67602
MSQSVVGICDDGTSLLCGELARLVSLSPSWHNVPPIVRETFEVVTSIVSAQQMQLDALRQNVREVSSLVSKDVSSVKAGCLAMGETMSDSFAKLSCKIADLQSQLDEITRTVDHDVNRSAASKPSSLSSGDVCFCAVSPEPFGDSRQMLAPLASRHIITWPITYAPHSMFRAERGRAAVVVRRPGTYDVVAGVTLLGAAESEVHSTRLRVWVDDSFVQDGAGDGSAECTRVGADISRCSATLIRRHVVHVSRECSHFVVEVNPFGKYDKVKEVFLRISCIT